MNATPTPQLDFWKWLRENAHKSVSPKFGFIHPAAIRKMAMECFNLRSYGDLVVWQKANRRRWNRTISASLREHGLRMKRSRNGTGYTLTEKIAA